MGERSDREVELAKTWNALGIDVRQLLSKSETAMATPAANDEVILPTLLETSGDGVARLTLGEVLGEGGMGVVHSATQTSLRRRVAVKTVREDAATSEHVLQLLREGRVTGFLEHPNIVPVHALGQDDEGRPLIVMKQVEGTPWTDLIDDVPKEARTDETFLRKHLRILQQVATALHFGHSRGVLHRDVKPDNVMIGPFGEVYLLDWGIAVSTTQEPIASVPRAKDVRNIEGTPVYMAPEMAEGDGSKLGVWSDVYLLGATLHHVISGDPPHLANDVHAVLLNAYLSKPADYPDVPQELVTILHRAMARESPDRYASAAAFGDALEDFLTHRDSLNLAQEAERRTAELERAVEGDDAGDRADALFHEAHFAFDQALRSWPENERARAGRAALLVAMTRFELKRGAPRAALALIRLQDAPPRELEERVRNAVAQEAARQERLAALEQDVDPRFGLSERIRRALGAALLWALLCIGCGALTRFGIFPIDHDRFALIGLGLFVLSLGSIASARKTMLANAPNRRIVLTSLLVFSVGMVLWPILGRFGLTMPQTTVIGAFVAGALWGGVAIGGKAWLPMPVGHFIIAFAAWVWPAYHFEIFGLTAFPILATAWLMIRDAERARESSDAQSRAADG
ncbi:MAG: protein kinase [Myxococcota bacterium]